MTLRSVVVFTALLLSAATAQAGSQLFEGSWTIKAFGNELTGGAGASALYSAFGIPQGIQCNPNQPRCPFESTPTDGAGNFAPLGGSQIVGQYCAPWVNFGGEGTTERPAKGETATTGGAFNRPIPPLYRNPGFFSPSGEPLVTSCTATSTNGTGGKGLVQAGKPVMGTWTAITTGTGRGGFNFAPAPVNHKAGIRVGQGTRGGDTSGYPTQGSARSGFVGEFNSLYPYVYIYTYATLRNDAGVFGPGQGPGSFSIPYYQGANTVAKVVVKQGAAKFGGTMRMLGQLTTKYCYYRNGGCSIYSWDWRYDAIGAAAHTSGGVVTKGYIVTYCDGTSFQCFFSPWYFVRISGSRFPWTTGSVTVTAKGRGPHKTVHYAKGYDNRTATSGRGTIQLVSPTLTRWLQPCCNFETGGIGILRIKFIPEPHTWAMLVAGVSLLGVSTRMRRR